MNTEPYEYFNYTLSAPKRILAPMVDASEPAFRQLSYNHGIQLGYTPMIHTKEFIKSPFAVHKLKDEKLIVQLAGNEPHCFAFAAQSLSAIATGFDLNLGCPQNCAKHGGYGSWLQEDYDKIRKIVHAIYSVCDVPLSAKIRIQSTQSLTLSYVSFLESLNVKLITVHGRTREQRGIAAGDADWTVIREVKRCSRVPIVANGSVYTYEDYEECLRTTGADAVMVAEGMLYNPCLLQGKKAKVNEIVKEYLSLCDELATEGIETPMSYVKGHIFKLCRREFLEKKELYLEIVKAGSHKELLTICSGLEGYCEPWRARVK